MSPILTLSGKPRYAFHARFLPKEGTAANDTAGILPLVEPKTKGVYLKTSRRRYLPVSGKLKMRLWTRLIPS